MPRGRPAFRDESIATLAFARKSGLRRADQQYGVAQVTGSCRQSPGPEHAIGAMDNRNKLQPSRTRFSRVPSPSRSVTVNHGESCRCDCNSGWRTPDPMDTDLHMDHRLSVSQDFTMDMHQGVAFHDIETQDLLASFELASGDAHRGYEFPLMIEGSTASPSQTDISGSMLSVPGTPLSSVLDYVTHTFPEPWRRHHSPGPKLIRCAAFPGHSSTDPIWLYQQDSSKVPEGCGQRSRSHGAVPIRISAGGGADPSAIALKDRLLAESPRGLGDLRPEKASPLDAIPHPGDAVESTFNYYDSYDSPQSPDYYHHDSYKPEDEEMEDTEDAASNSGPSAAPNNDGSGYGPTEGAGRSAPKRGRESNGGDQGDWLHSNDSPQNKRSRRDVTEPRAIQVTSGRFACPYQKFDPVGEIKCGHPKNSNPTGGFKDVNRLKAHLKECHDPSTQCSRCWRRLKRDLAEEPGISVCLGSNANPGGCQPKPRPRKYWMTEEEKGQLIAQQYGDDVERWHRFMHLLVSQPYGNMTIEDSRKRYSPWYMLPQSSRGYPTPSSTEASSLLTPAATAPTPFASAGQSSYTVTAVGSGIADAGNPQLQDQTSDYLAMSTIEGQDYGDFLGNISGNGGDAEYAFMHTLEDSAAPLSAVAQAPPAVEPAETTRAASTTASTMGVARPLAAAAMPAQQGQHSKPDVGRMREQIRRQRDQINQTLGDVTAAQKLLQDVLPKLAPEGRKQVEVAVALLEDIQCRFD